MYGVYNIHQLCYTITINHEYFVSKIFRIDQAVRKYFNNEKFRDLRY